MKVKLGNNSHSNFFNVGLQEGLLQEMENLKEKYYYVEGLWNGIEVIISAISIASF